MDAPARLSAAFQDEKALIFSSRRFHLAAKSLTGRTGTIPDPQPD